MIFLKLAFVYIQIHSISPDIIFQICFIIIFFFSFEKEIKVLSEKVAADSPRFFFTSLPKVFCGQKLKKKIRGDPFKAFQSVLLVMVPI